MNCGLFQPGQDQQGQHAAYQRRDPLGPGKHGGHHRRLLGGDGAQAGDHRRYRRPQEGAFDSCAGRHGDLLPPVLPAAEAKQPRQQRVAAGNHRHHLHQRRANAQQESQQGGKQADTDSGQGTGSGREHKQYAVDKASGDQLGHGQRPDHHRPGGKQLPRQLGQHHQGHTQSGLAEKTDGFVLVFHSVASGSRLANSLSPALCFPASALYFFTAAEVTGTGAMVPAPATQPPGQAIPSSR